MYSPIRVIMSCAFVTLRSTYTVEYTIPAANQLDEMMKKMTSLEELSVSLKEPYKPLGYDRITFNAGSNPFSSCPNLGNCTLSYSEAPTLQYLEGLINALRTAPCWTNFRELTVDRFADFDESEAARLRSMMEGRALFWLPD